MKFKKGQGLPMNTIVIAAIVLIVMVVIIYIFVGGMSQTTTKLGSCAEKGGQCSATITCAALKKASSEENPVTVKDWVSIGKTKDCPKTTDTGTVKKIYCCVPLKNN